jgi:ATP-dependent DNA ligase
VTLPLAKTYAPMEALPAQELPSGPGWQYEPKWDGFRCIAFRDGAKIHLESKLSKSLTRYFPELVDALADLKATKFVLDGEIVIPVDGNPSFDHLLMRIHPAASRVLKLSKQTPSVFIIFDLLVDGSGRLLVKHSLRDRRKTLEKFAKQYIRKDSLLRLSPVTDQLSTARKWFHMGVGLDGIVAKRTDLGYQSGNREGMRKIKTQRTADCVVGGFRYLAKAKQVGSLLLGLYDNRGLLDHVGFCSSISNEERPALTKKLQKLIRTPGFTGRAPGGPSRWSTKHSLEWEPLATKLVVEVQFDHFTGGRFRHGTRFLRWRPEKSLRACTMDQVEREHRAAMRLL